MTRQPNFSAWVEDRHGRVIRTVAGSSPPVVEDKDDPPHDGEDERRHRRMLAFAHQHQGPAMTRPVESPAARDDEFRAEYAAERSYFESRGVTQESYVQSRRVDEGLAALVVGSAAG